MKLQTDTVDSVEKFSAEQMAKLIADSAEKKRINEWYNRLSFPQKEFFHTRFSKIFRDRKYTGSSGTWSIKLSNKTILLPLKKGRMWLDWDSAVSIVGHDIEIKQTYLNLINAAKPDLFIDVGANYGTHSLLFLAQNIETLTFEPNTACHPVFEEMCKLNNVSPQIKATALGERRGRATLIYPEERTWFGSTDKNVAAELSDEHEVKKETVKQKPLNDFLPLIEGKKSLIKIDTEGNELNVLQGAEKVLDEVEPMIIFESFGEGERGDLYTFFKNSNYSIYNLPWHPKEKADTLRRHKFLHEDSSNFIAIH